MITRSARFPAAAGSLVKRAAMFVKGPVAISETPWLLLLAIYSHIRSRAFFSGGRVLGKGRFESPSPSFPWKLMVLIGSRTRGFARPLATQTSGRSSNSTTLSGT